MPERPIISTKEARKILGSATEGMSDEDVAQVVQTLHSLAKGAIEEAKRKLHMKKDAQALAELVYDIYKEKKKDAGEA